MKCVVSCSISFLNAHFLFYEYTNREKDLITWTQQCVEIISRQDISLI